MADEWLTRTTEIWIAPMISMIHLYNDTTLIWKNIEEIQNFFISSNYHNFPINTKIIINKNKIFFHFIFQSMDINLDINRFTT